MALAWILMSLGLSVGLAGGLGGLRTSCSLSISSLLMSHHSSSRIYLNSDDLCCWYRGHPFGSTELDVTRMTETRSNSEW